MQARTGNILHAFHQGDDLYDAPVALRQLINEQLWLGHFDLSDSLGCVGVFDDPRYRAAEASCHFGKGRWDQSVRS